MEMQRLKAPPPPPPGRADLASFSALTKYYERSNGFRFPEAELRQQRESTPDGGGGKQRDFPGGGLVMPLLMGTRKDTDIQCLAVCVFACSKGLCTWVDD